MPIEIVEPDHDVYRDIAQRFEAYNRASTDWGATTFSAVLREDGDVVAAARGVCNMGLVEVRGVWVDPDLRGDGHGRSILLAVEAEARRRGCTRAALDTYSWQARGFYERLGYRHYATLDYPNGTSRLFLQRDL